MNKIIAYFRKPAHFNTKPWVAVVVASLLVGFLLALFQPFGISNFNSITQCVIISGFALVTALSTAMVGYVFPLLFKRFYCPEKWTIGKSILNQIIIISLIGIGNFLFDWSVSLHRPEIFWSLLWSYLQITVLIGIVPATIVAFIVQNNVLKQNLRDAQLINSQLTERLHSTTQTAHTDESETIVLSGTTKESIKVSASDIIYLESFGNYIIINYLYGSIAHQKQLRTTITQVENDLCDYSNIIRCHRAYMVNTSFIINAEGNSQGLQLSLRSVKEKIPVSRSYSKIVREKLAESVS